MVKMLALEWQQCGFVSRSRHTVSIVHPSITTLHWQFRGLKYSMETERIMSEISGSHKQFSFHQGEFGAWNWTAAFVGYMCVAEGLSLEVAGMWGVHD